MPVVKALKSFNGRYGMIRAGTVFNCDPAYMAALNKNKGHPLVAETDEKPATPGPGDNRSIPEAPNRGGKGPAGGTRAPNDTAPPPAGGAATTSASLRQDLASRAKTLTSSNAGAKGGTKGKAGTVEVKSKATGRKTIITDPEAPPPDAE